MKHNAMKHITPTPSLPYRGPPLKRDDIRHLAGVDNNGYNVLHFICNEQRTHPYIGMTLRILDLIPPVACSQAPTDGQLRGQTPLHIVCGGRDVEDRRHEVIAKLVEKRADIEARDLNDRTPLLVTAGGAYRKGALMLHRLGADMTATKPNGRNFADEAWGSNRKLAQWWCEVSGLQPSGVPRDPRAGLFHREGTSEKRYARYQEKKGQQKRMQATIRSLTRETSQPWSAPGQGSQSQSSQSRTPLEPWTAPDNQGPRNSPRTSPFDQQPERGQQRPEPDGLQPGGDRQRRGQRWGGPQERQERDQRERDQQERDRHPRGGDVRQYERYDNARHRPHEGRRGTDRDRVPRHFDGRDIVLRPLPVRPPARRDRREQSDDEWQDDGGDRRYRGGDDRNRGDGDFGPRSGGGRRRNN